MTCRQGAGRPSARRMIPRTSRRFPSSASIVFTFRPFSMKPACNLRRRRIADRTRDDRDRCDAADNETGGVVEPDVLEFLVDGDSGLRRVVADVQSVVYHLSGGETS